MRHCAGCDSAHQHQFSHFGVSASWIVGGQRPHSLGVKPSTASAERAALFVVTSCELSGVFFVAAKLSQPAREKNKFTAFGDPDSANISASPTPTSLSTMAPLSGDGVLWLCLGKNDLNQSFELNTDSPRFYPRFCRSWHHRGPSPGR